MRNSRISHLLRGTPSALLALGAGFVMASSANIYAALGMGAAVLLSLLFTSIVVSLIHKIIPAYAKVPVYLIIITGFVTLITMLMQAFFPNVANMLGVHLACLSVSAVIFRDAEEDADTHNSGEAIITAIITGVFLTVIMVICALIREPLGSATIGGKAIPFLADYKISAFAGAFGGYLVLAIVLAAANKLVDLVHTAIDKNRALHNELDENREEEGN